MPQTGDTRAYFEPAARGIVQQAMSHLWHTGKPEDRTTAALEQLLFSGADRLREALRGTPAWTFIDPDVAGARLDGITATLMAALRDRMLSA